MLTIQQRILKQAYQVIMFFANLLPKKAQFLINERQQLPTKSVFDLPVTLNSGVKTTLAAYKGKKLLLVNTASNCGFTGQYEELETLYKTYGQQLMVIGFPCNEFRQQEPADDAAIASFCRINYGVTFPLAQKTPVLKTEAQHPVYEWLTQPLQNGWCSQAPTWNFCKYLLDEEGRLVLFADSSVSPLDTRIIAAVQR